MQNVLTFQKDKESISRIVREAWNKLNKGGFLYFTLFGADDPWSVEHADTMKFYEKDEALSILPEKPYYFSKDHGMGPMMKGGIKEWHILHFLYIKKD